MKKKIKELAVFLSILLSIIMVVGGIYYSSNYKDQDFEQLLFYAFSGVEHTAPAVVNHVIKMCIVPVILLTAIIWLPTTEFKKTLKIKKVQIYPCKFIVKHKKIYLSIIYIIAVTTLVLGFKIDEYIYNRFQKTYIYEEHYTEADKVNLTFPEEKRNLIVIIAESMENSICSKENGGGWSYSIIPELEKLAKENTNFSNTEKIGGAIQLEEVNFTAGGMVGITSGNILKIYNPTELGEIKFVDGAYSLGEVLAKEGYNLEIMMGSDGNFGGRTQYFTTNGNYKIFDVNYAIEQGKMKTEDRVWWGFEDDKLFEWSKEEITNLASQDEPFNYIMLTADTHFVDGYLSENVGDKYETQYENVHAYSSKSIYEFVDWIKKQDFYENTTIVILGDHLGMQTEFYTSHIDENYERTIYNVIINSTIEEKNSKSRTFTTLDMYPTILASIGVQIEGERLGFGTNLYSGMPTLSEELGFDYLNKELSKYSEYYNKKILKY